MKKQGNDVYFSVRLEIKLFNQLYTLLTRRSVHVLKVGVSCGLIVGFSFTPMDSIVFVPFRPKTPSPGWKCPKRFKLGLGSPWESSDSEEDSEREIDSLLIMASQQYEEKETSEQGLLIASQQYKEKDVRQEDELDFEIDNLLIMASQQYEEMESEQELLMAPQQYEEKERRKKDELGIVSERGVELEGEVFENDINATRYGSPKSTAQVTAIRKGGVPVKTQEQNGWAGSIWRDWARYRRRLPPTEKEEENELKEDITEMTVTAMNLWLCKFVVEVRRKDKAPYAPDTLYQICCGLLRLLKEADRAEINIFDDPHFQQFKGTLDARMKELKRSGNYQPKRAAVISEEHERLLWNKNLLGDVTPQQLINTMVFYIGLFFALRSGAEHRNLRFYPSQIELVERNNERAYLQYTEDVSKSNQGGLASRKKEPKQVVHYENVDNPERCLIRLYKLYMSKCPKDRPDGAFYLKPLSKPKDNCWFCKVAIGHNTLQQVVPNLFKAAGITGHYTNHSLRVTSATRLFEASVDEQLIMQRTGHSSTAVRAYKRIGEKLKPLTSDVLNNTVSAVTKEGHESVSTVKKEDKEISACDTRNRCVSFAGASNFTVTINYNH